MPSSFPGNPPASAPGGGTPKFFRLRWDELKDRDILEPLRRIYHRHWRRPPYFRVTPLGFAALLILAFIAAAAVNTGTNLLYLMLSTLVSFIALGAILPWFNLHSIRLRRAIPRELYAGETAVIGIEASNLRRWTASYGLTVTEYPKPSFMSLPPPPEGEIAAPLSRSARRRAARDPGGPYAAFFLALPPGKRPERRTVRAVFERRGEFSLEALRVSTRFPFGFIAAELLCKEPEKVLVYPALIDVDRVFKRASSELGLLDIDAKGRGAGLYGIRDYAPGEPARTIHWRLSAKGTGIKAREFDREESRRVRILLRHSMPDPPSEEDLEKMERRISAAASLAKKFLDAGVETALWTPGGSIPPGRGTGHLRRIMRTLALAEPASLSRPGADSPPAAEGFLDVEAEA